MAQLAAPPEDFAAVDTLPAVAFSLQGAVATAIIGARFSLSHYRESDMAQKKKGSGKPRKKSAGKKPARKPKKKAAKKTSRKKPPARSVKRAPRKKAARKKVARKKAPRKKAPRRKAARKKALAKKPARKKAAAKKPLRKQATRGKKTARGPARAKAATKRAAARDSAFFDHFRQKLLEQRQQITRRLDELREELRGLEQTPRELEEWAQEEKDRDILIRLEDRETDELRKIQAALGLIDRKEYGSCQICGKPIPRARLEELPTAFRCVDCTP